MAHDAVVECVCGCVDRHEVEAQLVCTDCGRAVSDLQLCSFEPQIICPDGAEGNGNFVPATGDGSHLCAPTRQRALTRMPGLKSNIEFLSHLVGLPQPVLDQATAMAGTLCGRCFQHSSESSRACVALFVACREERYPMTLRTLCQWMSVGIQDAQTCLRIYTASAPAPHPLIQADSMVNRCVNQYADAHRIPREIKRTISKLANRLLDFNRRHVTASITVWSAAACILLALALATDIPPSARVAAALDLGIEYRSLRQRHLLPLAAALHSHAQHSPSVATPPARAANSASLRAIAAPLASAVPTGSAVLPAGTQPAATPGPHANSHGLVHHPSIEPLHPNAEARVLQESVCVMPEPAANASAAAAGFASDTHRRDTSHHSQRPETALMTVPQPQVQLVSQQQAASSPGAAIGSHQGREAAQVVRNGTSAGQLLPCSEERLGMGAKRAMDSAVVSNSNKKTARRVERRCESQPGAVGLQCVSVSAVDAESIDDEAAGWLGQGQTALSLCVVEGVLDVDECLALIDSSC